MVEPRGEASADGAGQHDRGGERGYLTARAAQAPGTGAQSGHPLPEGGSRLLGRRGLKTVFGVGVVDPFEDLLAVLDRAEDLVLRLAAGGWVRVHPRPCSSRGAVCARRLPHLSGSFPESRRERAASPK